MALQHYSNAIKAPLDITRTQLEHNLSSIKTLLNTIETQLNIVSM